jgi:phosphoglucomutase
MRAHFMQINPLAGTLSDSEMLLDVPKLITAYYQDMPDSSISEQRVSFGTNGHRGTALLRSFNEPHILAITQAICDYRKWQTIDGPLFLGIDTHALSAPAYETALEVLAANGVDVMIAAGDEYTPTPVISHAILTYNRDRKKGLADGIVLTPSHNPPQYGGFKYNPPQGGPAGLPATNWIETQANALLGSRSAGVKRVPISQALSAATTHRHDYLSTYVADLDQVLDLPLIRASGLKIGVDPLGGAGVHYWPRIAEHYGLDLTVVNDVVDPTFRFVPLDWDGQIRMDPSSVYTMQPLIRMDSKFDICFACDTDHDRHGVVTRSAGLLSPNHYFSVAIFYLCEHRPKWRKDAAIGKTVVTSAMLDRVAAKMGRKLFETPVGYKWFVDGFLDGSIAFAGEESAGASFLRLDGTVWTTDKDGIVPGLLAAEITAGMGRDPGEIYRQLASELGEPVYERVDAPATPAQKNVLAKLQPLAVTLTELAGEKILSVITNAPGNGASIGGLKVSTASGWFAARPSGTENIYKIYAESFRGADHVRQLLEQGQNMVDSAFSAKDSPLQQQTVIEATSAWRNEGNPN